MSKIKDKNERLSLALKKNLKKRKIFQKKKKKNNLMSVLSDKWIRKMSKEHNMISPFEEKQVRGKVFLMVFHHLVMMQEFQMNLKFLQM